MIARQRLSDFARWKMVLDSHSEAQRRSGLARRSLRRNMDDPNHAFMLFEVTDLGRARGFVISPAVPELRPESSVVGETLICFLE